MPQDKRKSIRYRSFVTCDDPKGVIECGSIRKTKISSSRIKELQPIVKIVVGEKKQDSSNINSHTSLSSAFIKEDKKQMGVGGITREVMEVSKGADKLNHVINSWSQNKMHQNDIAKDLLRGALDLQDSLTMLSRLQEASSGYRPESTKKERQNMKEIGQFDSMVNEVIGSRHFSYLQDQRFDVGIQRPRLSFEGYPSKPRDEMKNAVRESLFRRKMINNPVFEEHVEYRKYGSPDIMMPSTSSSHSSFLQSSNFAPSDSSFSSTASSRRPRRKESNYVVKLMGVEAYPSSPRRHREERIYSLTKPVYDIDSPRARKGDVYELGRKQRTVDEILESLKFKGLLRSSSVNELMHNSPCSELYEGRPPIVIMKPMRFSCIHMEEPCMSIHQGDRSATNREMFMKPRFEESGKAIRKVASSRSKVPAQKRQETVKKVSEVAQVAPNRRKGEEKKSAKSSQELTSRDHQAKSTTSKIKKKKNDGVLISKKQQSKQAEKNRQPETAFTGENQRIRKEEFDSACENDFVLPAANNRITTNFSAEKQTEAYNVHITDYDLDKQCSLPDTRGHTATLHSNQKMSLLDVLTIPHEDANEYDLYDNQSTFSDITSSSTSENTGYRNGNKTFMPEVTLVTTHENGVPVCQETGENGTRDEPIDLQLSLSKITSSSAQQEDFETSTKFQTPRARLKVLLLSSQSFVQRAEELFAIQVNFHPVEHRSLDEASDNVLLDYAHEVMELTNVQNSYTSLPLPRYSTKNAKMINSLDELLEEIFYRIEDLRCYVSPPSDSISSDSIYCILDQDLRSKSGPWELGWRCGFSYDDVEQIVGEVDKLILGKLIEEVLVDFML